MKIEEGKGLLSNRGILYLISLILQFNSVTLFAQQVECEDTNDPDLSVSAKVRIYFGNGMSTKEEAGIKGIDDLEIVVGNTADRDFAVAVNSNENFLRQLIQLAAQKGFEARDSWYYVDHPEIERNPLSNDIAKAYQDAANLQYGLDGDLRKMVADYLKDMNSGKKVVVAAHSQGNFYANSAYEYIKNNYPEYRNSIGLVAVASPAKRVQDGGYHYTNSKDKVINFVRRLDPNPAFLLSATASVPAVRSSALSQREKRLLMSERIMKVHSHEKRI